MVRRPKLKRRRNTVDSTQPPSIQPKSFEAAARAWSRVQARASECPAGEPPLDVWLAEVMAVAGERAAWLAMATEASAPGWQPLWMASVALGVHPEVDAAPWVSPPASALAWAAGQPSWAPASALPWQPPDPSVLGWRVWPLLQGGECLGLLGLAEAIADVNADARADAQAPSPSDRPTALQADPIDAPAAWLAGLLAMGAQLLRMRQLHLERTSAVSARESLARRMDVLAQTTQVAAWDLWLDTGRLTCDPHYAAMLGIERPQMAPQTLDEWLKTVHPDDLETIGAVLKSAIDGTEDHYECELRVRRADGTWMWLLERGRVMTRDSTGRALWLSGTHMDIHNAKTTEESLLETSAHLMEQTRLLQVTLGSISQGIIMWGSDGRVCTYNPRVCELLDIPDAVYRKRPTLAELTGFQIERGDFGSGFHLVEPHARHHVASNGGRDMPESYLRRTKDGRVLEVRTRDLGSEGLVRTFTDVTGYIEARDALRVAQARSREITESALDAILVADGEGAITYVNPAAARSLGFEVTELLGVSLSQVLSGEQWRRPPTDGAPLVMQARRADGSSFSAEASVAHAAVGDERVVTVILRDISERLVAEARIRALNESLEQRVQQRTADLEQSMRDMEAISYSMAHDLRAPLRAMNGYAVMVLHEESGRLTIEGRHKLERVVQSARNMGTMIDDLLGLFQVLRAELVPQPVDMQLLAKEAVRMLGPAARRTLIELGDLPVAMGDATLLRQIVFNLLDNALKYSQSVPGARVSLGFDHQAGAYRVSDNGMGFDMAYADKLFGVFQRLHPDTPVQGTGIGLSIVARVVERHGGRIWAQSAPGEGATFWFTLPLATTNTAALEHQACAPGMGVEDVTLRLRPPKL
jgi:PAS domain S-box-containing protein